MSELLQPQIGNDKICEWLQTPHSLIHATMDDGNGKKSNVKILFAVCFFFTFSTLLYAAAVLLPCKYVYRCALLSLINWFLFCCRCWLFFSLYCTLSSSCSFASFLAWYFFVCLPCRYCNSMLYKKVQFDWLIANPFACWIERYDRW